MTVLTSPVACAASLALFALACSSPAAAGPHRATATATAGAPAPAVADAGKSAPASPAKSGPTQEKAQALREAADQLDKAQFALDRGNKNLAEQLFSTAELLVGPDALVSLAPLYRAGAPTRVATPTTKIDVTAAPQPKVAGNSEADDEAAKVAPPKQVGALVGTMTIGGKPGGAYGLVTLEPASGKWKPRMPKQVVIEQRGREFLPSLVAISVGSTISFPNFDNVFHNVFSTSQLASFDLGLYKSGEARAFTFEKPGFIRLGCNLHANMSAYIAVVSAPSYVVTDEKGAFAFKRLTPGKYKLRAWSTRSTAAIEQEVTVKAGANEVTVGVQADAPSGAQPDKFGGKRG